MLKNHLKSLRKSNGLKGNVSSKLGILQEITWWDSRRIQFYCSTDLIVAAHQLIWLTTTVVVQHVNYDNLCTCNLKNSNITFEILHCASLYHVHPRNSSCYSWEHFVPAHTVSLQVCRNQFYCQWIRIQFKIKLLFTSSPGWDLQSPSYNHTERAN